jgi:hypothetical protein
MGMKTPRQTAKPKVFACGDVVKTHPFDGYWGCALVLTARDKTEEFNPMCHIGITPVVFTRDYKFQELDISTLTIMECETEIRVGPYTYAPLRRAKCIGIYARKINSSVNLIGNIDVSSIIPNQLSFEVGDGTNGGWPLCGPVSASLGCEAVHAWRSVHDRTTWLSDVVAARKSHEEMLLRLKEKGHNKGSSSKGQTPNPA